MLELTKPVEIARIAVDSLAKDDSFPAAIAFHVELAQTPDAVWRELFVSEYEQAWFNLKREVTLHGNRIRIVCATGEEEAQVRFVRGLVENTNKKAEEYNQQVERERKLEQGVQEQEAKLLEEAKDRLRKVRI